jgi:Acyl-CoA reductase (LuxC)
MTAHPVLGTAVPHIVKGRLETNAGEDFGTFRCPSIRLDDLVWQRHEPGPAFDLPIGEVIDFLVEVGAALDYDTNEFMQQALEHSLAYSSLARRILENTYRTVPFFFDRANLEFQIEQETGWEAIDGWQEIRRPQGNLGRIRAFPPRLAHVIAGNTPAVAVTTIVRGALSKGVHLIKVPTNDLFTAAAILRTMAQVDPEHPTVRSFSAVYWKGGDTATESAIMRPQFFDKMVVWGGDSAVRNALRYAGPGFEIVSFDPKVSISMVGREAYANEATLEDAADRAATDVTLFNQDACAASRYIYAEGDLEQIDRFCEQLLVKLRQERPLSSAVAAAVPNETRDEIEVLKTLEPIYRVWGDYSGAGLVVRSDDPVDFYPMSKTVNVVTVPSLEEAVRHANVATQTVGIYPPQRAAGLRDALASMGVQRIVALGEVAQAVEGLPHDGFYPIRRVMRWVLDDTAAEPGNGREGVNLQ